MEKKAGPPVPQKEEATLKIKAAVVREAGKLEVEELELGKPRWGEVLVKLLASGICHTDASALNMQVPGKYPMVLGHEGVGIVEEIGPGVESLLPGDRVILSFPSCGRCEECLEGRPYACDKSTELFFHGVYADGDRRITDAKGEKVGALFGQGSLADHCIVAERNAVKADPEVELKALCSLACGAQTGAGAVLNKMKPSPGDAIAVFGCGAVGISAIMAAKLSGCGTIIGVDVVPSRLELSLECGATHVIHGRDCPDIAGEIRRLTGGKGVRFALEASGVPALVPQMLAGMRKEGLAVLVSFLSGPVELDATMLFVGPCVSFAGTVEGASNPQLFIPKLVQFFKEGRLPVDRLATYYPFAEVRRAFEESRTGKAIKPIVVFD